MNTAPRFTVSTGVLQAIASMADRPKVLSGAAAIYRSSAASRSASVPRFLIKGMNVTRCPSRMRPKCRFGRSGTHQRQPRAASTLDLAPAVEDDGQFLFSGESPHERRQWEIR